MRVKTILIFTTALATSLGLSACDQPSVTQYAQRDTAVCVDHQGQRVPDDRCGQHYYGGASPFLWYYLGRSAAVPYYGERVYGGGFTRTAGATYFHAPSATAMSRSVAVSRGGFGSSAHAFGGFGE